MTARVRVLAASLAALVLVAGVISAAPDKKASAGARKGTAASRSLAPDDSDAVLVRVGGVPITRRTIDERLQEIPEQYRANYQTPEGRQQLLDRMIEERVWLLDAESHHIQDRPDVMLQMEHARRDLLIKTRINELLAGVPAPSDSETQAFYDQHVNDFRTPATVALKHIQLKTEADARRVLALARAKGADWGKLVNTWSTDSLTKSTGGSLGTATKDGSFGALGPQPALAESAMALGEGKIGGPYHTNKGWHVIRVESYHAEAVRPVEQVRSYITRQLTQQRQNTFYQNALSDAKARYKIAADSAVIGTFLTSRKTAREMFQAAQQAGTPDARIDAYRQVVQAFPDADVAPQAQFMVGFIYSEELKKYDEAEKAFRELLAKYPKSELTNSAQWMVDHMRTEEAPDFLHSKADSIASVPPGESSPKK